MPAGTPVEQTAAVLRRARRLLATVARGDRLPGLCRHRRADQLQRARAPVLPAQRRRSRRHAGEPRRQAPAHASRATPSRRGCGPRCRRSGGASAPTSRSSRCRPARRCWRRSSPRSTGPRRRAGRERRQGVRAVFERRRASSTSTTAASPRRRAKLLLVDRRKARAARRCRSRQRRRRCAPALAGEAATYAARREQVPGAPVALQLPRRATGRPRSRCCSWRCAAPAGAAACRSASSSRVSDTRARAADPPQGPAAGELRRRRHGRRASTARCTACSPCATRLRAIATPGGGTLGEYFIRQPDDPYRDYAIKWDGEWQITYETFRDMGAAYAVGLVLIYLLVVAQFGSYLTPLDHHGADPADDHRRDAGPCAARRAVHRHSA